MVILFLVSAVLQTEDNFVCARELFMGKYATHGIESTLFIKMNYIVPHIPRIHAILVGMCFNAMNGILITRATTSVLYLPLGTQSWLYMSE